VTNPCINLIDGIYGNECSRYYYICLNKIIYDYICPENYIFNKNTKNCLKILNMPKCNENEIKTMIVY
jgi:hypothetical protein